MEKIFLATKLFDTMKNLKNNCQNAIWNVQSREEPNESRKHEAYDFRRPMILKNKQSQVEISKYVNETFIFTTNSPKNLCSTKKSNQMSKLKT
jgi:hypothetical protein